MHDLLQLRLVGLEETGQVIEARLVIVQGGRRVLR